MRPQRYVAPTVRRWMEGGPAPTVNASGKNGSVLDLKNVLMGAMRPQRCVEPTVRRWQEGLDVPMVNVSTKDGNVMESRTVMMGAMRMPHFVAAAD